MNNGGKRSKIIKFRRIFKFNVGTLIIYLMAAYFVFSVYSYLKRPRVNYYEVVEGSIVREHNYTGVILREEELVDCESTGYINYYIPEGQKAGRGSVLYSVDESGSLKKYLEQHSGELNALGSSDIAELHSLLLNQTKNYSDLDFDGFCSQAAALRSRVSEYANLNVLSNYESVLKNSGITYREFRAGRSGVVAYYADGYEDLTEEGLTERLLDRSSYQKESFGSGEVRKQGEPCCKIVTGDLWKIAFVLNEKDLEEYSGKDSLKVRFGSTGLETSAGFSIVRGADGASYGILTFRRYMVQFVSTRFVEFEVISNNVSGLKLPEKSIIRKEFCVIPTDYYVTDENGNRGFYKAVVSEEGTAAKFVITDIYNADDEYCYIEPDEDSELKTGDFVTENASGTGGRYQIGPTKPLEGVYNVNKGYTVFRLIERLETSNGYSIVKRGTPYGLSVYDHIVLDAETVGEGQIVFR